MNKLITALNDEYPGWTWVVRSVEGSTVVSDKPVATHIMSSMYVQTSGRVGLSYWGYGDTPAKAFRKALTQVQENHKPESEIRSSR